MPRFEAVREERSFVDAHGVTIHFYVWRVGKPTAIVQLAHGVGEHALRYEAMAQDLVNAGYTVYADDHRGHGATGLQQHGGDLSRIGRLGPGGVRAVVADFQQLSALIRAENPEVPLVLLGHSWGSLITQKVIAESADAYDAVVLSGTALRTVRFMESGDLARRHRRQPGGTDTSWLSRDPAVGVAFEADPLTTKTALSKLFGLREALRLLGRPSPVGKDVPLLIQVGDDDPLSKGDGVERLAAAYRGVGGLSDVTVQTYAGARHEVYNETNRDEVIADLVAWLDAHLKYVPPRRRR